MGFRGSAMKIRGRNRRRRGMSREWRMEDAGDVLFEVMRHLDDKSLGIAACVCRSWRVAAQEECVWQEMCAGYWPVLSSSAHLKSVVVALGGFRRLYVHCLRPLLFNNNNYQIQIQQQHKRPAPSQRSRDELHLSLSLFSIDCYERLGRKGSCLPTSLHFLSRSHVKNHQPHHYHHHHIHDSSSLSPPASSFCSSSSSSSSSACPRNFACKGFSTA